MPLITNMSQLRQYVTGISFTTQETVTLPNFTLADQKWIVPIVGNTIYPNLIPGSIPGEYATLADLCCAAVAPLAMMDMLARKQVQLSDMGLHSRTTENLVPAPRWAYLEFKESLMNDGCSALEQLWAWLFENGAAYPFNWQNPYPEKTLFTDGTQFSKYFYLDQPYRIFAALLPIIAEVEDQYLYANFGEEFVQGLRDTPSPNSQQQTVLTMWRKGVANLAISKACSKLAVRITDKGFTVLMGDSGDQPFKGQNDSSYTLKQALKTSTEMDGISYISQANNYLNASASSTVFPDYFSSTYYDSPSAKPAADPNKYRKGVFAL